MLPTETETFDQIAIPLRAVILDVVQQSSPFANKRQQAATGRKVLAVLLEVLRQFGNPPRQQRDLNLRGPHIFGVDSMLGDDFFFNL